MNKKGFSLLEVVIVALIISLLALFATMDLSGQTGRVNRAKIQNDLQQLKKAMAVYAIKYKKYPQTLTELQEGLQKNSQIKLPKDPHGGSYSIIHKGDLIYIGTYSKTTEEVRLVEIYEEKGFNLVEIMVVIAILGILVVVGFPYLQKYMISAKMTKTQINLTKLKETIKLYQMDANNNRAAADRMRLDNGTTEFSLQDLVKYKYIGSPSVFMTGWGEKFELDRRDYPGYSDRFSLFAIYNVYINEGIKLQKEEFVGIQE